MGWGSLSRGLILPHMTWALLVAIAALWLAARAEWRPSQHRSNRARFICTDNSSLRQRTFSMEG